MTDVPRPPKLGEHAAESEPASEGDAGHGTVISSDDADERSVRSILRRAHIGRVHEVDLLGGVQRRIRERSRGRFYRDGWSRGGAATSTYVLTSLLMLVILALVYFVLLR
jgi:hypothetical protein